MLTNNEERFPFMISGSMLKYLKMARNNDAAN